MIDLQELLTLLLQTMRLQSNALPLCMLRYLLSGLCLYRWLVALLLWNSGTPREIDSLVLFSCTNRKVSVVRASMTQHALDFLSSLVQSFLQQVTSVGSLPVSGEHSTPNTCWMPWANLYSVPTFQPLEAPCYHPRLGALDHLWRTVSVSACLLHPWLTVANNLKLLIFLW